VSKCLTAILFFPADYNSYSLLLTMEVFMGELLFELWSFMKERKKFWLLPIILCLVLFGSLLVFTSGSAVAPFIYTLF
jgi:Family of unknown function (DUF5989)